MGIPSRCGPLPANLFVFIYSALLWSCSALFPWGVCLQKHDYSTCIHLKLISAVSICFHSGKRLGWICSQRCVGPCTMCARQGRINWKDWNAWKIIKCPSETSRNRKREGRLEYLSIQQNVNLKQTAAKEKQASPGLCVLSPPERAHQREGRIKRQSAQSSGWASERKLNSVVAEMVTWKGQHQHLVMDTAWGDLEFLKVLKKIKN